MLKRDLIRQLVLGSGLALSLSVIIPARAADDTIKVGVLHSLSGTMAISETTLKDTVLMLIDEQNKKGGLLGKKLEAVVVDPASNWPLFAEKARELIEKDKVAAVFGCWTSVSRKSVLPVVEELNGLLFYPVQYEGEESSKNVFYTGAAPNQQAIPAVDYLMKPVEEERLAATIDRVRQRLTEKRSCGDTERLKEILIEVAPDSMPDDLAVDGDAPAANRYEKVLNIKDRGQIFRVDVADIERIDAAGDYMCIYTADQTLILRETMKDLERRLDPRKFQRIHRSTIVNLDNIKSVKPHTNGECFLVLGSNTQVKVSRSYREVVARFL